MTTNYPRDTLRINNKLNQHYYNLKGYPQIAPILDRYSIENIPRKFKIGPYVNKLWAYVEFSLWRETNLKTVKNSLLKKIKSQKLYDPQNPEIIMADNHLEEALGQRYLHVSQLDSLIDKLMMLAEPYWEETAQIKENFTPKTELYYSGMIGDNPRDNKFVVNSDLLNTFKTVKGFSAKQLYSFEEISAYLTEYIIMNQEALFEHGNFSVAYVKNDQLGVALGVQAFHRSQTKQLLRRRMIPVQLALEQWIACTEMERRTLNAIDLDTRFLPTLGVNIKLVPRQGNSRVIIDIRSLNLSKVRKELKAITTISESQQQGQRARNASRVTQNRIPVEMRAYSKMQYQPRRKLKPRKLFHP